MLKVSVLNVTRKPPRPQNGRTGCGSFEAKSYVIVSRGKKFGFMAMQIE